MGKITILTFFDFSPAGGCYVAELPLLSQDFFLQKQQQQQKEKDI